jgi:predicted RND superfamily exporter protein
MTRLEKALGAAASRAHRRPLPALLLALALVGLGAWSAARLTLNTDLTELLPQSFESVKGLEKLKQNFGGIGYVAVAGYDAEPEALRRFADDMAPRIEALPGIRFVEYQRASTFFGDRALYYLSLEDLTEVESRLRAREKYERRQKNPMYIKLDEEEVPSLDFSDIEKKYSGQSSRRLSGGGESYYLDVAQRMVVLLAKPEGNSSDLSFSRRVVNEVQHFLDTQDLKRYGPNFKVQLTGTYKKKVDQQGQIAHDLSAASTVALALLIGYLLFHFRSGIAVLFNLLPVAASLIWTYGVVGWLYGSVNLLTGFLAAILGGLGIEHGIHLLGRYEALRDKGQSSEMATREAFSHTGVAALISALVAALTFLSLAISEFRAFREFGVIAALGMLLVVGAYVLVLPALLGLATRFRWSISAAVVTGSRSELARWLLRPRFRRAVAIVMGVWLVALSLNSPNATFNYDFAALEDNSLPSFIYDKSTNKVLGYSQTPVVVLTSDPATERAVVAELTRRRQLRGTASTVDFVAALDDLVPQQQPEKQQILASIGQLLDKVNRDRLDADARKDFDDLKKRVTAQPFTRADLPESVRRQFMGIKESRTGFVLVFPAVSLADGTKVREFAREVRSIVAPDGHQISAAGEAMILADIIDMVTREMPLILTAAVLSVLLVMTLTLASFKLAVLCLSPTVVSLVALTGLMPLFQVQFNYLNIIVLTVLIGVTVDAGVHLISRLQAAGEEDFTAVYGETGRAICGGILTSAVGFGAMLLADHPGLNSIGQMANLGFATNLLVMLLAFPAFLLPILTRRKNGASGAEQQSPSAVSNEASKESVQS